MEYFIIKRLKSWMPKYISKMYTGGAFCEDSLFSMAPHFFFKLFCFFEFYSNKHIHASFFYGFLKLVNMASWKSHDLQKNKCAYKFQWTLSHPFFCCRVYIQRPPVDGQNRCRNTQLLVARSCSTHLYAHLASLKLTFSPLKIGNITKRQKDRLPFPSIFRCF